MRGSKDIAKRLRFELRPRPYAFRRLYGVLGAAACAAGVAVWFLFGAVGGERQYLPGPVAPSHATFGDRCEKCHTQAFAAVPDEACGPCHAPLVHSAHEVRTPACRECHVDHRGEVALLGLGDTPCVGCHAELETKRTPPAVAARVADFEAHPVFVPLREGFRDPAALRFNHEIHLTSSRIPVERKLDCPSCHVAETDGGLMRPIVFETHCRDCHRQGGLGPLSDVEVVHEAPDVVRRDLRQQLLLVAVNDPQRVFGDADFLLPGRSRGPIDQSSSLAEYERSQRERAEGVLYAPFVEQTPYEQHNKYCFLCHLEGEPPAAGEAAPIALLRATEIPRRWLERARFSHAEHALVPCEQCHPTARTSKLTSDVNLPSNALCQRCHADGVAASAGTQCTLCHLYHEEAPPQPGATPARIQSIEVLTGQPTPAVVAAPAQASP